MYSLSYKIPNFPVPLVVSVTKTLARHDGTSYDVPKMPGEVDCGPMHCM